MKILYSHRTQSADGQWVHISELTQALKARGCDVLMAGPANDARTTSAIGDAQKKSRMRSVLPAPVYEAAEYGYSLLGYWRLLRQALGHKPDILYERYNLFYHAGAWLKRETGLPFILEVNAPLVEERSQHGNLFWKSFAQKSERSIWQAADKILCVSAPLAERVCAAGIDDKKIIVVPNGVSTPFLELQDHEALRRQFGLEGKTVLGFSGFIRSWHGVDRVIEYLAHQQRDDLHALIVGDGPARPDLEALAQARGVQDKVTFAGIVAREEMPAMIASFDIALQPASVAYASPLKLFEYMAQAKPVIAPDQPNIREILADNDTAILFTPEDNEAFDKALTALLNDPALQSRLGVSAREELIKRDLTWSGAAARVKTIAEELVGNNQ